MFTNRPTVGQRLQGNAFMNAISNADSLVKHSGPDVRVANTYEPRVNWDYAIKGMLMRGQVAIMPGPSNGGKTAIAICMGWHVIASEPFAGRRTRRGIVVHVAAERPDSILNRAATLIRLRGRDDAAPYLIYAGRIDLSDPSSVQRLLGWIADATANFEDEVRLIIIDTAVLCIGYADENSSRDVSIVMEGARRLAIEANAAILLLHHTGKEGNQARGSSAWRGSADQEFPLRVVRSKAGEHVEITDEKARDAAKGLKIPFRIEGHVIGQDDDGDEVTVAVAELLDNNPAEAAVCDERNGDRALEADRERAATVLTALRTLRDRHPERAGTSR
jgi:RecA-family ATPase